MATSALRRTSAAVASPCSPSAMPVLAPIRSVAVESLNGSLNASWMRSAMRVARSWSPRSSRTANSSPPSRAGRSLVRRQERRRRVKATSSSSPISWPKRSLTCLKSSRSRKSTTARPSGRAIAASTCSVNSARLASPVSGSWWARCSSRSRSSVSSHTACSSRSCSSETAVWLASVSSSVRSAEVNSVTRPSRLASAIAPSSAVLAGQRGEQQLAARASRIHGRALAGRGAVSSASRPPRPRGAARRATALSSGSITAVTPVERDRGAQRGAAVGGEEVDLGGLGVERGARLGQQLGRARRGRSARGGRCG